MKRQVNLGIFFSLLKGRGSLPIMGIIFTVVSIFVLIPLLIILPGMLTSPYQKYDFKGIEKNGIEKTAKITELTTVNNVSINDQHPIIIGYQYDNNGQQVADKFETLDLDKLASLNRDSEITVLVYQNQSMIKGFAPFSFPIQLFYLLPAVFLIIGIPALLGGIIPTLKTFNLYKNGIVKEAYVVSMNLDGPSFPPRGLKQNVLINYYFEGDYGARVYGKAKTNDLLVLNGKKAGDKIKIFVSEKDENQSCLVPNSEAMKNNWDLSTAQLV